MNDDLSPQAGHLPTVPFETMARQSALELLEQSAVAMVGSNGPGGYPWIKAMFKMRGEGLDTVWFSTNTSSARVAQFRVDPRASVYFVDATGLRGLLLVGEIEVLRDQDTRRELWREGFEVYYPRGVDDPDYTVLRFNARSGNYYHGLKNITFTV